MQSTFYGWGACLLTSCLLACQTPTPTPASTAIDLPPAWAQEVVWYQIFVERFRNGDTNNDPQPTDLVGAYPGFVPDNWAPTPWSQDWYKPDPYFAELLNTTDQKGNPVVSFAQKAQLRRYGGDLQGVLDKVDYLDSLGVTAIYFNPLNDAPSLHKYDPRHWRHIDRNFGPNPQRDQEIIALETPHDPSSWRMTTADSLFVEVIAALHAKGIRVILDYSWNHTGQEFWALQDVKEQGKNSLFQDWYEIERFDDPATAANEFAYQGWFGVPELPELKETVKADHSEVHAYEGNLASPSALAHIKAVATRWLDPNGDGDPADGVDGYRLDVAGEIGLGFWREFRTEVRRVNPEAYLLGEIWWRKFPDHLLDPEPFLQGDVFDAVMNYRWYRAARHFFAAAPDQIPVSEFVDSLNSFAHNLRPENHYAMMNLTASHDAPRVGTSLFNSNKYKFEAGPAPDRAYRIHKPDSLTLETQRLLLVQQFTYIGAPHIWAGDEMGMWGGDDPDTRKPLIWPDISFEPESHHPYGMERPLDTVKFNTRLFQYYQRLIDIRRTYPVLSRGDLEYVLVDDARQLLAYRRFDEDNTVLVVFNAGNTPQEIELPWQGREGVKDVLQGAKLSEAAQQVTLTLPGRRAAILMAQ